MNDNFIANYNGMETIFEVGKTYGAGGQWSVFSSNRNEVLGEDGHKHIVPVALRVTILSLKKNKRTGRNTSCIVRVEDEKGNSEIRNCRVKKACMRDEILVPQVCVHVPSESFLCRSYFLPKF